MVRCGRACRCGQGLPPGEPSRREVRHPMLSQLERREVSAAVPEPLMKKIEARTFLGRSPGAKKIVLR